MLSMNMESLNLMSWPSTLKQQMKRDGCPICPPIDEFAKNVMQLSSFLPFYRMFIDDGLIDAPRLDSIKNLVAASIEACYLLLGYPGPIKKLFLPPTLAWDKMCDCPIGPNCVSLGICFLTKYLEISIKDYKVERLVTLFLDV